MNPNPLNKTPLVVEGPADLAPKPGSPFYTPPNEDAAPADGGAAFPRTGFFHTEAPGNEGFDTQNQQGMTLRAWLAGQALAGIATDRNLETPQMADLAVRAADFTILRLRLPSRYSELTDEEIEEAFAAFGADVEKIDGDDDANIADAIETVTAEYPDSDAVQGKDGAWIIVTASGRAVSGAFDTPNEAWLDAANQISDDEDSADDGGDDASDAELEEMERHSAADEIKKSIRPASIDANVNIDE